MRFLLLLSLLLLSACSVQPEIEPAEESAPETSGEGSEKAQQLRQQLSLSKVAFQGSTPPGESELAKIQLGRILFFDPRLSGDHSVSCNSCHNLQTYGTGAVRTGERDVPSIYNLAGLEFFNWDARHTTLSAKISDALLSETEMQMAGEAGVVSRLQAVTGYAPLFKTAFPKTESPLNYSNTVAALESFVTGLNTPAPIDRFIAGDETALTEKQIAGGLTFIQQDCRACHTGPHFGGQMLQKIGITQEWPNQSDLGAYHHSKVFSHKMLFRVSPLRNVDKTAPYFHDASSDSSWDAINRMALHERGQAIRPQDALAIRSFFKALTGKLPLEYIQQPTLPE